MTAATKRVRLKVSASDDPKREERQRTARTPKRKRGSNCDARPEVLECVQSCRFRSNQPG
jgi:hypothetical protein